MNSIPVSLPAISSGVKTESSAAIMKPGGTDSEKSARAAGAIEKFEGLFMSMMIKQMRQSESGGGLFPGDASDTYGGLFDMFMGDYLAAGSRTGLENLFRSAAAVQELERYVLPSSAPSESSSQPQRHRGLEEYRNEQIRAGAIHALPHS